LVNAGAPLLGVEAWLTPENKPPPHVCYPAEYGSCMYVFSAQVKANEVKIRTFRTHIMTLFDKRRVGLTLDSRGKGRTARKCMSEGKRSLSQHCACSICCRNCSAVYCFGLLLTCGPTISRALCTMSLRPSICPFVCVSTR